MEFSFEQKPLDASEHSKLLSNNTKTKASTDLDHKNSSSKSPDVTVDFGGQRSMLDDIYESNGNQRITNRRGGSGFFEIAFSQTNNEMIREVQAHYTKHMSCNLTAQNVEMDKVSESYLQPKDLYE